MDTKVQYVKNSCCARSLLWLGLVLLLPLSFWLGTSYGCDSTDVNNDDGGGNGDVSAGDFDLESDAHSDVLLRSKKSLEDIGYEVVSEPIIEDSNEKWSSYMYSLRNIDTDIDEHLKGYKNDEYWAIYYPSESRLGGDAWVFVLRESGEVFHTILGQ